MRECKKERGIMRDRQTLRVSEREGEGERERVRERKRERERERHCGEGMEGER